MKNKLNPIDDTVSRENIWNFRQNHPELIVDDLTKGIAGALHEINIPAGGDLNESLKDWFRSVLLARGVNKWFAVRRDLIAYKKQKKHQIKAKYGDIVKLKELRNSFEFQSVDFYKANNRLQVVSAELRILEEVRGSLKAMCMRDRWQIWEGKKLQDMNEIKCSD